MPESRNRTDPRGTLGEDHSHVNPWIVLVSVALGMFMVIVDITILNVALPTVARKMSVSITTVQWALIAYTLVLTGLVPMWGRVSDVLGRKRLFISGVLIFGAASLLAAFSQSILWLIGARVIQAIGGALITTNALAQRDYVSVIRIVPYSQRPRVVR